MGLGVGVAIGRQIACQGAVAPAVNCYACGAWVGGMGIASCPCGALMALLCGSNCLVGRYALRWYVGIVFWVVSIGWWLVLQRERM